ncbi:MAG: DedA family protein [Patescibacteria group bacterium]|nr:DedA family protein [Patescibacteria group bacterium]
MDILNNLVPTLSNLHLWGYWIALFFALFETTIGVGLFIPGSTAILLIAATTSQTHLEPGDLIFFTTLGAIIGDNINYYLGRKFGNKIFAKGFWFIKESHITKAKTFIEVHGSKSIFLARFIPSMKEFAPFIAGTLKMKRLQFTIWNILGAIGWSILLVLPAYFFGQSLPNIEKWIFRTEFFLLILILTYFSYHLIKYLFFHKKI